MFSLLVFVFAFVPCHSSQCCHCLFLFLQTEAMRVMTGEKLHTMQLMVEEERRNVEQLRQDMAVSQQVGHVQ